MKYYVQTLRALLSVSLSLLIRQGAFVSPPSEKEKPNKKASKTEEKEK